MCTVNKSVHTKKVWKLIECTSYDNNAKLQANAWNNLKNKCSSCNKIKKIENF